MSFSPYAPAGNIINEIIKTKKGLKTIAYNKDGELTCSKTTYAQSSHVLQHKPLLDKILREVHVDAKNKGLLYVLLYELLLGPNKAIRGGGSLKRQLLKLQEKLQASLDRLEPTIANKSPSSPDQSSTDYITIPRYVRVNTIVSSTEEVLSKLDEAKPKPSKSKKNQSDSTSMPRYVDPHVPNVLVFPPTASTRANLQDLVTSHQVVLQDKSSCFSALCMVHGFDRLPSMDGDFLDACAAPGNKTCHLAALLTEHAATLKTSSKKQREVVVHALDKSKDRFQLLERRMKELTDTPPRDDSATTTSSKVNVECHNSDFLSIDPKTDKTFSNVTAIMLDPSCSGSGMISNHQESMDRDPMSKARGGRTQSLSNFQFQALHHATSNFPKVQRVVYSTCSVYAQENEGVVQRLLESNDEWELVAPKCLEHWQRRGFDHGAGLSPEQLKCLIRVNPEEDGTNGFFVACFQRKAKSKKGIKNAYEKPSAIMGLDLYDNNQFDKSKELKAVKVTESSRSVEKASKSSSDKLKRKAEVVEGVEESSKVSKKRAKKMEWKKKQREKKLKRLAAQQAKAEEAKAE
ncbi:MAG: hypothetical protein SGBAC_012067 [Bacillariaceae sp.]